MLKTVTLHTLGCKLNYSETSTISKQFDERGLKVLKYGEKSDIFVLNTCTVTENADKECKQIIKSVLKNNPETFVIITGCFAQLKPDEISSIEGVDLVLGTNEKFQILKYLDEYEKKHLSCLGKNSSTEVYVSPLDELTVINGAYTSDINTRSRAFLKIQDGCDYNCSFCTIPLARGKSRSLDLNVVIENAKRIIDSGFQEIVLTGVNIGDYKFNNFKFVDLLYNLDKLDIPRIRISSIEPNLLTEDIIGLISTSKKLCNHLHIPLQSGDDEILRLMRRRYNLELFKNLIEKLNSKIPNVGIGIDVIVGFPGETEKHFENTFNYIRSLEFSYLHVFTYSERENTFAINLGNKVDFKQRKKRNQILRNLSLRKRSDFYSKHIGKDIEVLFENKKNDLIQGWTKNYIRVEVPYSMGIEHSIKKVKIIDSSGAKKVTGIIL